MDELDNKILEHIEIKNEIQKVEKNFIQYTVDNLEPEIIRRKSEIVELIDSFYEKYMKYDMNNDRFKLEVKGSSSLVISQYFFKPIIPIIGIEPKYNAEKMAIVFDSNRTTCVFSDKQLTKVHVIFQKVLIFLRKCARKFCCHNH